MKYLTFSLLLLVVAPFCNAQVGIGNTNPQAILDISASDMATPANNDGLLIPRVDEFPATNPTAAQDGMMVFVTGGGSVSKGFYYWDNAVSGWNPISSPTASDADWYEDSTTSSPSSINDDVYTLGNVGIGNNAPNDPLDIRSNGAQRSISIENTSNVNTYGQIGINTLFNSSGVGGEIGINNSLQGSGTGSRTAIFNTVQGNSNVTPYYGIFNIVNGNGSGPSTGSFQRLNGSGNGIRIGSHNEIINSGNGQHYGNFNNLTGSGGGIKYGSYNTVSSISTNPVYSTYNNVFGTGTGNKFGTYNRVISSSGGTHYGVYSDVLKLGSFAGYFLGDVAIGTSTTNNYVLPASRGTANQIMQTDGVGNVDWADPPTVERAAMKVGLSSNIPSYTLFSTNNLVMDTVRYNLGGGTFNTSTGGYTIPYDGVYLINASIGMIFNNTFVDNLFILLRAYRNTTIVGQQNFQYEPSTSRNWGFSYSYSYQAYCNAGDIITFQFIPGISGTNTPLPLISGGTGSGATEISIVKVY